MSYINATKLICFCLLFSYSTKSIKAQVTRAKLYKLFHEMSSDNFGKEQFYNYSTYKDAIWPLADIKEFKVAYINIHPSIDSLMLGKRGVRLLSSRIDLLGYNDEYFMIRRDTIETTINKKLPIKSIDFKKSLRLPRYKGLRFEDVLIKDFLLYPDNIDTLLFLNFSDVLNDTVSIHNTTIESLELSNVVSKNIRIINCQLTDIFDFSVSAEYLSFIRTSFVHPPKFNFDSSLKEISLTDCDLSALKYPI